MCLLGRMPAHTALISDTGSERYGADIVAGSLLDAVGKFYPDSRAWVICLNKADKISKAGNCRVLLAFR